MEIDTKLLKERIDRSAMPEPERIDLLESIEKVENFQRKEWINSYGALYGFFTPKKEDACTAKTERA